MADEKEPAPGFEVFFDPSYWGPWAARKIGSKSSYDMAYFETERAAIAWTYDPTQAPDQRYN